MLRRLGLSVAAVLAIGCGSVTASNGGTGGSAGAAGGTAGVSGTSGVAGATATGGTVGTAGASGTGIAGASGGMSGTGGTPPDCYNGLMNNGSVVGGTVSGGPGYPQGGTVADGIYDFTSTICCWNENISGGTGSSVTIRVTGNRMDFAVMTYPAMTVTYKSYTFTVQQDTMLMFTPICGQARETAGYTATAGMLQLMRHPDGGAYPGAWDFVDVYTKR